MQEGTELVRYSAWYGTVCIISGIAARCNTGRYSKQVQCMVWYSTHSQGHYSQGHYGQVHYSQGHYSQGHYSQGHYGQVEHIYILSNTCFVLTIHLNWLTMYSRTHDIVFKLQFLSE